MIQILIHYFLHFIFIGAIAYWYDKDNWKKYWLILLATMLVDVDHLFADPMFHPNRCSIGFHYLHSEYIIPLYFLGAIFIKHKIIRLVMIGLTFHMITDFLDCLWMYWKCEECSATEVFEAVF
ncbi:DUF6122 family protein [Salinimicrobium xinjiangense]|uniref:DUF6122 family protein n=1 Tax=Salinimicrobium xinjiangense TaxID=438596 RepID=UPI000426F62C|nr:DUF6122 family protein [Salinimicrobium xinjiangense]